MNHKNFIFIPQEVAMDKQLKAPEKLLYGHLIGLSYKNKCCEPKNRELAELLGVSIEATSKYLRTLEESGYIIRNVIKYKTKEVEKRIIYPKEKHIEHLRVQFEENH